MKHRCPYCKRTVEVKSAKDLPDFPFCSERCRLADLNGWLSGHYVISRPMGEADVDREVLDATEASEAAEGEIFPDEESPCDDDSTE